LNPPISDWRGLRVWIVGASSGIGAALARQLHHQGARLILSARRLAAMQALGLHGSVLVACDLRDPEQLSQACSQALTVLGGVDVVVWMAGVYQPVTVDTYAPEQVLDITRTNYEAILHVLGALLAALRQPAAASADAASGTSGRFGSTPPRGLVLVSSVAGFRGLPKALAYGPTKAALTHLAEILHLELAPRGVGVWVIHPGFVQTPATAINDFHMPALISAEAAARAIVEGLSRSAFEIHFPQRFTIAMKLLALLPYRVYFALMRRGMRSAAAGAASPTPSEQSERSGMSGKPALSGESGKPALSGMSGKSALSDESGKPAPSGGPGVLPANAGGAPSPASDRAASEAIDCDDIVRFFEGLRPASLDHLDRIYRPDACFKDPFHEVVGLAAIRAIMAHMFRKFPGGSFVVTGCVTSEARGDDACARVCCLTWDYRVEFAGKSQCIRGASWLGLAPDGKIATHRDYWDVAEELYEKIPGLSMVMRWLKRQAKAG